MNVSAVLIKPSDSASSSPRTIILPNQRRAVGKSKFARNISVEISDEASADRDYATTNKITEEEQLHNLTKRKSSRMAMERQPTETIKTEQSKVVNPLAVQSMTGIVAQNSTVQSCECKQVLVVDDDDFNLFTF